MENKLINPSPTVFEQIKETDENRNEFWGARKLSKILEYAEFRNFLPVIERAKASCKNSGQLIENHFVDYHEMVGIGSGAERQMESVKLSRYACYPIVQNADPGKEIVAFRKKVRKTIQEIGGTMPENLPVADSIRKIEKAKEPKAIKNFKKKK